MAGAVSLFLDVLRLTSAILVLCYHGLVFWYPDSVGPMAQVAHAAVIVFFVLSGYVIAFVSSRREVSAAAYSVARLARVASVAAPALLLTALLQLIGTHFNPDYYAAVSQHWDALRYLLTTLCLQNIWFLSASPPTNTPFWSLSYEAAYYLLYGLLLFVPKSRWKWLALAAVMLLVGPNILLLLPCWLLGVLAFRRGDIAMSRGVAMVLAALAAALLVFIVLRVSPLPLSTLNAPLFFSSRFLTDWLIAALIAAMLVFARRAVADLEIAAPISGFARRLADQTFPLYLFHHPILLFVAALVPFDHSRPLQVLTVVAVMLAVIACLGFLCDASRGWWRQVFETGLRRVSGRRDSMHPLSK